MEKNILDLNQKDRQVLNTQTLDLIMHNMLRMDFNQRFEYLVNVYTILSKMALTDKSLVPIVDQVGRVISYLKNNPKDKITANTYWQSSFTQ